MCRYVSVLTIISDGDVFCYTRREPVGVVGAITPVSVLLLQYLCSYSWLHICILKSLWSLHC